MLSITNPTLKKLMLDQIVECIDTGGLDDLLQAGFSHEFLDALRHRTTRDLIKVSEFSDLEFRVSLKEDVILSILQRLDLQRRDAMMLEYFVRHGAAVQVICTLFRRSAEEVRALRSQLVNPDAKRTRMPPTDVRDRIHTRWHELQSRQSDATMRDQLYALHQSFPDTAIDALCRTLNEFNEVNQPKWQVTDFGAPL